MPFEWNNLEIAAQNLPTYESRVYESGADLYFIIVIVQFLEVSIRRKIIFRKKLPLESISLSLALRSYVS